MPRALRTPFQRGHELQFALEATERDESTGAVMEVSCRLCTSFGREPTPGHKRVKRASVGRFRFPFRVDTYKRHHTVCHPRMWQRYQAASTEGKRAFFGNKVALPTAAQSGDNGVHLAVTSRDTRTAAYGVEKAREAPEESTTIEMRGDGREVSWSDIDVMEQVVVRRGKQILIPYVAAIKGRLASAMSTAELHQFCLRLGVKGCSGEKKAVVLEYLARKKLQESGAASSVESAREFSDEEGESRSEVAPEPLTTMPMREMLVARELRLLEQHEEREKRQEEREVEKAKDDKRRAEVARKREALEAWAFVCDRLRALYRELAGEQHHVIVQQLKEEIVILETSKQQLAQSL